MNARKVSDDFDAKSCFGTISTWVNEKFTIFRSDNCFGNRSKSFLNLKKPVAGMLLLPECRTTLIPNHILAPLFGSTKKLLFRR